MKNTTKRIVTLFFALVMLLSLVAMPAAAAEIQIVTEADVDEEKILFTITCDQFRFPYFEVCSDGVYDDPDSSIGKAAVFSYADRAKTGDAGLTKALTPPMTLAFYCFGQTSKKNNPIGEPTVAQLKTVAQKDGYVMLLFQDVELFPAEGDFYAYVFDCWGLQIPFKSEHVNSCVGELVDVYLSMKITGDLTDPVNNPPTYYIDKVVVCEATAGDQVHECTFGDWTITKTSHSRTCEGCGTEEKAAHQWDAGTVIKEPSKTADGEKSVTCTVCGTSESQIIPRIEDIEEPAPRPSTNNTQKGGNNTMVIVIAVGMFILAAAVVVVALLMLKKKKD